MVSITKILYICKLYNLYSKNGIMPYTANISEQRRSLIALLIDQSGSMGEPYSGTVLSSSVHRTKAEVVAEASNVMLMDILARCRQGAIYKHYFDIILIGYSGRGVYSLLSGDRWMVSPSELAAMVRANQRVLRRVKLEGGGTISHYNNIKIWVEPQSDGATPMCSAIKRLTELISLWRGNKKHNDYFPPTIINITDGEATDATPKELLKVKERLAKLSSQDGEPVLFNLHISNNSDKRILFPRDGEDIPPEAQTLYELSSIVPEVYNDTIATLRGDTEISGLVYRAFSYNLPMADLIGAMQIGTTTTQQIHR